MKQGRSPQLNGWGVIFYASENYDEMNKPRYRALDTVAGLLRLLRPRQWIKNGFVLAPLVFAGQFMDGAAVIEALFAVCLFCVAASAVYIVNDWHDAERDREHPTKSRQRPLASGQVSKLQAAVLLSALYGILLLGWLRQPETVLVILAYIGLNLAYTYVLKHQPVIDIFTVAIGFVLRVYAGAVALTVPLSSWMFATTLCLALYLAAVKRRQELAQIGKAGRKVLEQYSISLVDRYAEMSATGALLFYSLFVIETQRPELVLTIPLVLYGLFRYWFVVESQGGGESPTDALLSDWQLSIVVLLWAGVSVWVLWPAG